MQKKIVYNDLSGISFELRIEDNGHTASNYSGCTCSECRDLREKDGRCPECGGCMKEARLLSKCVGCTSSGLGV